MIYLSCTFNIAKDITPIDNKVIALLTVMLPNIFKTNVLTPIPSAMADKINLVVFLFIATPPFYFHKFTSIFLKNIPFILTRPES